MNAKNEKDVKKNVMCNAQEKLFKQSAQYPFFIMVMDQKEIITRYIIYLHKYLGMSSACLIQVFCMSVHQDEDAKEDIEAEIDIQV